MFTNTVRSMFLTTQGCLLRLNTLVALQCAENVVFIAIDNQNPHGGRIFSASTADKRKKYSPPPPPLANPLLLQLLPLSSYVMRILSVHCYEDDIFRRLKCIQSI